MLFYYFRYPTISGVLSSTNGLIVSQSELDSQIMQRVLQALKAGIAAYKITAINMILSGDRY